MIGHNKVPKRQFGEVCCRGVACQARGHPRSHVQERPHTIPWCWGDGTPRRCRAGCVRALRNTFTAWPLSLLGKSCDGSCHMRYSMLNQAHVVIPVNAKKKKCASMHIISSNDLFPTFCFVPTIHRLQWGKLPKSQSDQLSMKPMLVQPRKQNSQRLKWCQARKTQQHLGALSKGRPCAYRSVTTMQQLNISRCPRSDFVLSPRGLKMFRIWKEISTKKRSFPTPLASYKLK